MTVQKVIKRDGELVEFDINKIRLAVLSAITSCNILDDEYFDTIMDSISDQLDDIEENINLSVESIQDIVVSELKESDHPEVGIHYSDYRRTRELNRNSMLNIEQSVQRLLDKDEDVVNENANKDANVYNTQRDLTAGMVAKAKGLKDLLPTKVANAHIKGQIHWHDLDYSPYMPMTNCSVINAKGLLSDSIQIGNAIIKEPRSIGVATAKLSRIIESIASVQYGGISVGDIDLVLEPYANLNYTKHMEDVVTFNIPNGEEYARKKTIKDIYNAMQSLENEINSMSSSSGQSPFVTISIGWGTSWICKEIQKAVLNVRINKLNGKVAIFPKILFFHKKGLNFYPQDPNYDIKQLAIKCSSVALYPDILNVDRLIEITGHRVSSMGK